MHCYILVILYHFCDYSSTQLCISFNPIRRLMVKLKYVFSPKYQHYSRTFDFLSAISPIIYHFICKKLQINVPYSSVHNLFSNFQQKCDIILLDHDILFFKSITVFRQQAALFTKASFHIIRGRLL